MTRYLSYSAGIHLFVLLVLVFFSLSRPKQTTYYGFQFMGGQSGFGSGVLEPAPAPLTTQQPGGDVTSETPPTAAITPDPERVILPKKPETTPKSENGPGKKADTGRNTKKGQGVKDGRGEATFGRGDFQGSKTGAVGGVGTSLDIGGFGPGSGGQSGSTFPFKWYADLVYKRLWESWDRAEAGTLDCRVTFVILRSGQVRDVRVRESSGDAFFDLNARRAVNNAAPFPPLPDGFEEKELPVTIRFRLQ